MNGLARNGLARMVDRSSAVSWVRLKPQSLLLALSCRLSQHMTHIKNQTLRCLLLTGLLLIEPQLGLSGAAEIDPSGDNVLALQCADRIEKWFPLLTIQTQDLDLDHIKIIRVEQQLVVIPLKKSHGIVKGIRWRPKELTETLDFIRLLQQGKIGAVNVLPFLYDPAELYMRRGNVLDQLKGCQQKEQVQEVLGQCTECTVREWLDLKP
jgi:hypothetical protein